MIGIQVSGTGFAVASWTDSGPELIGTGKDLGALTALARARSEIDASAAVIAVPAYYNDEQRAEVRARAQEAGIAQVRIVNEPVAIALAYGASRAVMPGTSLVLSSSECGALDATVLGLREGRVEVLATNGIADPPPATHTEGFFAAIEPVVNRALADAGLTAQSLDAIILAGDTKTLRAAGKQIEAAWGRSPEEPPSPETAIAIGAATFGRMMGEGIWGAPPETTTSSKPGCFGLLALTVLVALPPLAIAFLRFR